MTKVLRAIDNVIMGFLNWIYSLPPETFKEYEIALIAYLVSIHYINPSDQAKWIAIGFAAYGIVKSIREVTNASVTKATIVAGLVPMKNRVQE